MRLPPELWCHIVSFNYCHDEHEGRIPTMYSNEEIDAMTTLLACSQVSKVLRRATLPFLFHTLAISVRAQHDDRTIRDAGCSCRQLSEVDALRKTLPVVYGNVRELRMRTLCSGCRSRRKAATMFSAPSRVVDGNLLLSALSKFEQLRTLYLKDIKPSWGGRMPWSVAVQPMLSLDSFTYDLTGDIVCIDVSTLEPLLKSLTRVGKMQFLGAIFVIEEPLAQRLEDTQDPVVTMFRSPLEVTSLVPKRCLHAADLLEFLTIRKAIQATTLDSLSLNLSAGDDIASVPAFMRSLASNITQLTVRINRGDYPPQWNIGELGVAHCTRLAHFTFHYSNFLPTMSCDIIPEAIRSLRGLQSLRFITLIVDSDFIALDALMALLGERYMHPMEDAIMELGSIERVRIELPDMRRKEDGTAIVAAWARSVLSQLHRDGVVA